MTRRYTGAEARELRRGVGPFEVSGVVIVNAHPAAAIRCVADINDQTLGPLLAAAPDLAESLAAVEAERDEAQGAYLSLEANYNAQHTTLLALEAERDALRAERDAYREYYRARQALITADDADSTSVLFAAEDRVNAARERIAALREAAK